MTVGRRRRAIAEAARTAGLGDVVRIHREYSSGAVPFLLWMLAGLSAIPAIIASISLVSVDSTTWQWPLLALATLVGIAWLWLQIGPVSGGRHWIAVADGGLILWSRKRVDTIPWNEARDVTLGSITSLGDVRDSITRRRAGRRWTRRRILRLTITGLVTAVAAWFTAVPMALHVFVGERPTDITQFARMCDGGKPFGRTADYAGKAPHPVLVFGDDVSSYPNYMADPQPEPDTVQLVGCTRLLGTVPGAPVGECNYMGGHTWETYQGRYRVDIYEARTGRHVTSFNLDGIPPGDDCLPSILKPRDAPSDTSTFHTDPREEDYRAKLDPLVNG